MQTCFHQILIHLLERLMLNRSRDRIRRKRDEALRDKELRCREARGVEIYASGARLGSHARASDLFRLEPLIFRRQHTVRDGRDAAAISSWLGPIFAGARNSPAWF